MNIWKQLNQSKKTYFTTPTHSQKSPFIKELGDFYKRDLSEVEGLDNISCPKGIIKNAQRKASEIYDTEMTFFLTQGSTTGILAIMKAIIRPNDRVLVARNCHRSVYSGLVLTYANVDWFMPDTNSEISTNWGIYDKIDPVKLEAELKLNDYRAFIITSPTYEGIVSDIETISKICKQYNTYLIVDEAHGALFNFSDSFPKTAIQQGADFSVNSLHKNAGAINQCALLHVSKYAKDVDIDLIQKAVNLIHTSSPSYPMLSVIEETIDFLHSKEGLKAIDELVFNILSLKKYFKNSKIEFLEDDNLDITKIFAKLKGCKGEEFSKMLYEKYNIEDELNNDFGALFLTGIGCDKSKFDKLKIAFLKILDDKKEYNYTPKSSFQPYPLVKIQPALAFFQKTDFINKSEAELMISADTIIPYPPGIGVLYKGEAIQKWHLDYLEENVRIIKL